MDSGLIIGVVKSDKNLPITKILLIALIDYQQSLRESILFIDIEIEDLARRSRHLYVL
jgi:hypothetical protein